MPPAADLDAVFDQLHKLMARHAKKLVVKTDKPGVYYLDAPKPDAHGKVMFFGSVQTKKSYVGYYLMPVYCFPDLLQGMSPELSKRMQGKSCFNFKAVDAKLFKELDALTKAGLERYKAEGYL